METDVNCSCRHYKPLYRERVIEYEDRYGNPYEYRDELLVGEFCYKKQDYILGERDCKACRQKAWQEKFQLPLAG